MPLVSLRKYLRDNIRSKPYFLQKAYFYLSNKWSYKRWKKEGEPVPACSLVKSEMINEYRKLSGFTVLVETGTYLGDTVFTCLKWFEKIFSIELDPVLYRKANDRFKRFQHVQILNGDSGQILGDVLKEVKKPAIFWLDGHYSGGITAQGEKITPIFEELKTIFQHNKSHILLIDDARLFDGTGGYPTLKELQDFLSKWETVNEIKIENDIIAVVLK